MFSYCIRVILIFNIIFIIKSLIKIGYSIYANIYIIIINGNSYRYMFFTYIFFMIYEHMKFYDYNIWLTNIILN